MLFLSLKNRLLVVVTLLVLVSGLGVAVLSTHRLATSLRRAMMAQAESVTQTLAYDSVDKVLINDLVGLQKMLDQRIRDNQALAYIFVIKEGRILAHTFERGLPVGLMEANDIVSGEMPHSIVISSTTGEHYLDIAWPLLQGKAGVVRLGYHEKYYRTQLANLWIEIALFTLCILLAALAVGLAFVRRITKPLSGLVHATREITLGKSEVRVSQDGPAEIATLATSFNRMLDRQDEYTRQLENQAVELKRAHGQTKAACLIVREMSALRTLEEMSPLLISKLQALMPCGQMVLPIIDRNREVLYIIHDRGYGIFWEQEFITTLKETLEGQKKIEHLRKISIKPPLVDEEFLSAERQTLIRLTDAEIIGGAIIACPEGCQCQINEIEAVAMILEQTVGAIKRAIGHEEEARDASGRTGNIRGFGGLIGKDPKMKLIYKTIQNVAPTDTTVLIQGESGTGKELVARAIHQYSPRQGKPFVVINCAAYPSTLLESELFGYEKGAFTGAQRQKSGRFEQANGGTVFLDEIGEISPQAQIRLLRVVQTRQFERLGGEQTINVDVRIIAATNKDLRHEVKEGRFREDLFYRINVIPMYLPPLRERKNDIPLLADHFLGRFSSEKGVDMPRINPDAMRLFLEYDWPGNVREIENTLEHAIVLAKGGAIEIWDLPSIFLPILSTPTNTMAEHESKLLKEILEQCGWNKKLAARRLGISRSTLYAKIKKYNLFQATN